VRLQRQVVENLLHTGKDLSSTNTSEVNRLANADVLMQMGSLDMLEPRWGCLAVQDFTHWKEVLNSMELFHRALRSYLIITQQEIPEPELNQFLKTSLSLCADMLMIEPQPNRSIILDKFKDAIQECKLVSKEIELPDYSKPLIEQTLDFLECCFKMVELRHTEPHGIIQTVLAYLKGIAIMGIIGFLTYIRLIQGFIIIFKRKRGLRYWLTCNDRVYQFQYFVLLCGLIAVSTFVDSVANWLLNPVGILPSGSVGKWSILPVITVMLPSREGTLKKGLLRVVGTLIGALGGYITGLALQENVPGGCAVLCFIFFVSYSAGVNPGGELSIFGGFHGSYGYVFQLVTYTSAIISLETLFSCSDFRNPDSLCKFTISDLTVIRLTTQLVIITCAVLLSHVSFPQRGDLIAREHIADGLEAWPLVLKESSDSKSTSIKQDTKLIATFHTQHVTAAQIMYNYSLMFIELPCYKPDPDHYLLCLLCHDLRAIEATFWASPSLTKYTDNSEDLLTRVSLCIRFSLGSYYSHLGQVKENKTMESLLQDIAVSIHDVRVKENTSPVLEHVSLHVESLLKVVFPQYQSLPYSCAVVS